MAIRIELKVAPAGADDPDNQKNWKTYRHTVAIPGANRLMSAE